MTIIGVYGLMSHTVSQRAAEFGIRQAVGADRWRIFRLVIGDVLVLIAIGLALGIGLAVAATRVLASQLYETQPVDLPTFAIVSALLALAALSACLIPARRATRVDPMVSLRHE
jgi:putative ABC transport system permease protein